MAAPKNNHFWKKRAKSGRDKIFSSPEELEKAACEYFKYVDSTPLWEAEQRKGSIVLPRGTELTPDAIKAILDPIIPMAKVRPYTLRGLCIFLGVNRNYFSEFKKTCDEDFSGIITWVEDVIYTQKFENAAAGLLNANIISRELGLAEKVQQEINAGEKPPSWLTGDITNLETGAKI